MPQMSFIQFIIIGIVSALIVVSWQVYKDAPWEGFSIKKLLRSFIISVVIAMFFFYALVHHYIFEINLGILLLTTMCFERTFAEIYKGFLKKGHDEYQEVFKHYHLGLSIRSTKIILGLGISVASMLVLYLFFLLPQVLTPLITDKTLLGGVLGFFGGLAIAIGGALKDTTFEPFNIWKFFRSPLVGMLGGMLLIQFSQSNELLVFASSGIERIVVECYKTFVKRRKRSIFAHKSVAFPVWMQLRKYCIATYCLGTFIFLVYLLG